MRGKTIRKIESRVPTPGLMEVSGGFDYRKAGFSPPTLNHGLGIRVGEFMTVPDYEEATAKKTPVLVPLNSNTSGSSAEYGAERKALEIARGHEVVVAPCINHCGALGPDVLAGVVEQYAKTLAAQGFTDIRFITDGDTESVLRSLETCGKLYPQLGGVRLTAYALDDDAVIEGLNRNSEFDTHAADLALQRIQAREDLVRRTSGARIAFIPMAGAEQHGPHLPVRVDMENAERAVRDVVARLEREGEQVAFISPVNTTFSGGMLAGTMNFDPKEVGLSVGKICEELARKGFSDAVFVLGHAGSENMAAVRDIERQLNAQMGHTGFRAHFLMVWDFSDWIKNFGYFRNIVQPSDSEFHRVVGRINYTTAEIRKHEKFPGGSEKKETDYHASRDETSMSAASDPDTVDWSALPQESALTGDERTYERVKRMNPDAYQITVIPIDHEWVVPHITQDERMDGRTKGFMGWPWQATKKLGEILRRQTEDGIVAYYFGGPQDERQREQYPDAEPIKREGHEPEPMQIAKSVDDGLADVPGKVEKLDEGLPEKTEKKIVVLPVAKGASEEFQELCRDRTGASGVVVPQELLDLRWNPAEPEVNPQVSLTHLQKAVQTVINHGAKTVVLAVEDTSEESLSAIRMSMRLMLHRNPNLRLEGVNVAVVPADQLAGPEFKRFLFAAQKFNREHEGG